MRTKARHLYEKLLASYWFVPGLMSAAATGAASAALARDAAARPETPPRWRTWLEVNTAEGARELLGTIAGSTITLAGVIFSITILALSFASSHYGPRLLRNFMRDRPSQVALGAFISTYLYCLLVLRTIGKGSENVVPHLAVAGALLLALGSTATLIFFVHHIARSLQASSIIAAVGRDLDVLAEQHAAAGREAPRGEARAEDAGPVAAVLRARAEGYVQAMSLEGLVQAAEEAGGALEMHVEPGDYVSRGSRLASLRGGGEAPSEKWREAIRDCVVLGRERTNEQDLAFPVDQLAEVAVRALSAGVNDPFTALHCINRLGGGLGLLAKEPWPEPLLRGEDGTARVFLRRTGLERLVRRAFDQILHHGGGNPVVPRQVMKALAQAAEEARPEHRATLAEYGEAVFAAAKARGVDSASRGMARFHEELREGTARGGLARPDAA